MPGREKSSGLQCLDVLVAAALLQFPKIERLLHPQPDLGTIAQELAQAHGHIRGNRPLLTDYLGHSQSRHAEAIGEILLCHAQVR